MGDPQPPRRADRNPQPGVGGPGPSAAADSRLNSSESLNTTPMQAKLKQLVGDFWRRVTKDEQNSFSQANSLKDVEIAISEIESHLAKRKATRYIAKIRPFLRALENYTSVIEVFVNVKPDLLGLIWGPIKFCLQIASNVGKAFDLLLDTYKRIGECLPMVSAVKELFSHHPHVEEILINILEDILAFHTRSIRFFSQRGWAITCHLTFRPFEDLFGDLIRNFDRSKSLLQSAADTAHFKEAQEDRIQRRQQYEENGETIKEKQWIAIREWLSPIDHEIEHRTLRERHSGYPSTTNWIYGTSHMKDWLRWTGSGASIFWLSGIPGAGKSILFSSIVDKVADGVIDAKTDAVAYFYCRHNDDQKSRYEELAKSLIAQLSNANSYCRDYLHQLSLRSVQTQAHDCDSFSEILQTLTQCFKQVFLAVDGLDECEPHERHKILRLLKDILDMSITETSDCQVRILVASCEERDIELALRVARYHLKITARHLETDIQLYISIEARKLGHKFCYDKAKQEAVVSRVVTRPKGMFLLARLIMDNLYDQTDREEVEEELKDENLPRGIGQAYGRIVSRILRKANPKTVQRSKQVLGLIASAKRSLYQHEIQGALAVNVNDEDVDFEGRQLRLHVKEICGAIIEVQNDRRIQFIHPTAKDFLTGDEQSIISLDDANLDMFLRCLTFLEVALPMTEIPFDAIGFAQRGNYAFMTYAIQHWMSHLMTLYSKPHSRTHALKLFDRARKVLIYGYGSMIPSLNILELIVSSEDRTQVLEKALIGIRKLCDGFYSIATQPGSAPEIYNQLNRSRNSIEKTIEAQKRESTLMEDAYGIIPYNCPVLACSRFWQGCRTGKIRDSHVKRHERPEKCPYNDCYFSTWGFSNQRDLAKHISIRHERGQAEVTWPTLKPQSIWKTLQGAIDSKEVLVLRELCIEATKHPQKGQPTELVLRAFRKGNVETAHVVLEYFATPDEILHSDKRGQTALHLASIKGDTPSVKIMIGVIKRGTWKEQDLLDPRNMTATHPVALAAAKGHIDIIEAFLSNMVFHRDVRAHPPLAPLLNAAACGHISVIKLWIDRFPASLGERQIETALSRAAKNGHEQCIRAILEKAHQRALNKVLASYLATGIDEAVKYVVSKAQKTEVTANSQALLKAASEGKESEVRRLVDFAGANINWCTSHGVCGSALQAAAAAGHHGTVRTLLELQADVNLTTGHHGTALGAASGVGAIDIIETLLGAGADSNILFRSFGIIKPRGEASLWEDDSTALHIAVHFQQKDAVELLLSRGASINQLTKTGWSALAIASSIGSVELVSLLFERGAALSTESAELETPLLHRAIRSSRLDLVTMFLDRGANIQDHDVDGNLPIHVAAELDDEAIAGLLIERGADATSRNNNDDTPLHARWLVGECMDVPSLLLAGNADVDARNLASETPLLKTLKVSPTKTSSEFSVPDLSYAHFLIDSGAAVNIEDASGNTPLHYLIERYHDHETVVELMRRMISSSADVAAKNSKGDTPMHGIRYELHLNQPTVGCQRAVKLASALLDAGADFDAENDDGDSPSMIAFETGNGVLIPDPKSLLWTPGKAIVKQIRDGRDFW